MEYICGPDFDKRILTLNPKRKISITMSGGVDSFVLYKLLGNIMPLENIDIFYSKRPDFDTYSHLQKLTERKDIIIIPEQTKSKNRFVELVNIIKKEYDYDEIYMGLNIIPHTHYFPEFNSYNDLPDRPWTFKDPVVKMPFLHLYKYHIIDLARQFSIDLSKTFSCISRTDIECGMCWQCREKIWGFNQLGLDYE